MAKLNDLTGKVFGKWKVLSWDSKKYSQQFWLCVCECGTIKVVNGDSLKKGLSKSCGCSGKVWCTKHGMEGTAVYNAWSGMIQRCTNPKYKFYHRYGGRGIKVCEEWRNSFATFYADMGDKPDGMSLDRINNDGDYEPSNCRWATLTQQNRNRSTSTWITYQGETMTVGDWAEKLGIKRKILERRIRDGWDLEKAFSPNKFGRWAL